MYFIYYELLDLRKTGLIVEKIPLFKKKNNKILDFEMTTIDGDQNQTKIILF